MSATSELLVEQIKLVEEAIATAKKNSLDCSKLEKELETLKSKFSSTVSMLSENKNVLKG